MARTQAEDFDDKQQFILDRAAEVFAAKGFAAASINDIAEATGMSKSAMYHYHASKEAILAAILTTHVRKVVNIANAAVTRATGAEVRFRSFVSALVENYTTARAKHIVLMNDVAFLSEGERREVRGLEQRLVRLAIEVLTPLNPAVMATPSLRKAYAMFFYGTVNWTYTWYDPTGSIRPDELADRIAGLFMDGFVRQQPSSVIAKRA